MRNISLSQFLVVGFICFLLFGDYGVIKKKVNKFIGKLIRLYKKTRKKGFEPLTFGFGNHCSTNWTILLFMTSKSYYFEIKNRFTSLLLIWLFCFIIIYFHKETLMFLFKPNYLSHYQGKFKFYFIFTDVREVLSAYITIIFFIANQIFTFLMVFQVFIFFSSGLYYSEYSYLKKWIGFSLFFWIGSILVFNRILLPTSFNFFLSFQNLTSIESVQMYFESKLTEYLDFYIALYFICGIYGQILLFLAFFLDYTILNLKTIKKYRKVFFSLFLLFATLITPPDIFSQIFLTFSLALLYEFLNFINLVRRHCKILIR